MSRSKNLTDERKKGPAKKAGQKLQLEKILRCRHRFTAVLLKMMLMLFVVVALMASVSNAFTLSGNSRATFGRLLSTSLFAYPYLTPQITISLAASACAEVPCCCYVIYSFIRLLTQLCLPFIVPLCPFFFRAGPLLLLCASSARFSLILYVQSIQLLCLTLPRCVVLSNASNPSTFSLYLHFIMI
jgi:hypothetical protein